jgi:predicted choloylglycine hydrolase
MKGKQKIRIYMIVALALLFLILLCGGTISINFYNEFITIRSIKRINDIPAYEMNYKSDYAFDKYLRTGSKDYKEYTDFLNANLLNGIPDIFYKTFECSTFFARTPEGDYIMARNYDTTETIPFVLKTNSEKGYKTIGMVDLHNLGWNNSNLISKLTALSAPYYTFDGINEKGVAVASLAVPVGSKSDINSNKITLYDYAVMRLTIDKAKNVEDAIKQLSHYNINMSITYPSHYMIADEAGNCAIIDYIDGSMKVIRKEGSYQIATNMISFNNEKHLGYSANRYEAFDKALSETEGIISVEDAFKLLEENTTPGEAKWSSIYNLTDKTMCVEFYGDYDNTYSYQLN